MNSRILYTLGIPALAVLLCLHSATAQVKTPAKSASPAAKLLQEQAEKAAKEELAKRLEEIIKVQKKLPGAQPAPAPVYTVEKAPPAGENQVNSAKDLANRIDELIDAKLKKAKVKAAPLASDSEFFRRLHLDLSGQIPTLLQMRDYQDEENPAKRGQWIEKLLEGDLFPTHMSHVWASILLSNRAEANLMNARQSFQTWLHDRFKQNQPYDLTARELILLVRKPAEPGAPNAFTAYHGNKPEDQTGAVARAFLGVKIECAQCHAHPFADWSKQQFWEFAAFFDPKGIKTGPNGFFQRPEITMPGKDKKIKATFLDGTLPPADSPDAPKTTVARWVASKQNPWFAKAAADHVWSYFFGVSLLEPLLEKEKDKNTIIHPELLNLLAKELADKNFDVKHLVRAIAYTQAYQRTSKGPKNDDQLALFGKMPVRSLSADQLFDSFMVATNSKPPAPTQPNLINNANAFNPNPVPTERINFLLKFYDTAKATESTTSILQALYLMNNKFVNDRIDPKTNSVLSVLANTSGNSKRQIETLYLLALSRQPSDQELQKLIPYVDSGGTNGDRAQALSDVLWALLNSSEFAVNH